MMCLENDGQQCVDIDRYKHDCVLPFCQWERTVMVYADHLWQLLMLPMLWLWQPNLPHCYGVCSYLSLDIPILGDVPNLDSPMSNWAEGRIEPPDEADEDEDEVPCEVGERSGVVAQDKGDCAAHDKGEASVVVVEYEDGDEDDRSAGPTVAVDLAGEAARVGTETVPNTKVPEGAVVAVISVGSGGPIWVSCIG
eukprot:TRINITY_DN19623_c0_g1_i1.p1 TRINITY_DN19623_c0_g1~~TRINITY_DN19623_c0_g1_i1.p1  ORF type:complete len:195 (+),score=34.73 TRINITY_DN19623_c0_g1_i1:242-826(+)